MRINFAICVLFFTFLSCNSKENIDLRLLPKDVPFYELNVENIPNFERMLSVIDSLQCNWDKNVLLRISQIEDKFENLPQSKNQIMLQPISKCDFGCSRERNLLYVYNDKRMAENEYRNIVLPEDSIKYKLFQFLLNPEKRPDLADRPAMAAIKFQLKPSTPLSEVTKIIRKMVFEFIEIQAENPEIELYFVPIFHRYIPQPPPPPVISK
jgi:hypothetical protein